MTDLESYIIEVLADGPKSTVDIIAAVEKQIGANKGRDIITTAIALRVKNFLTRSFDDNNTPVFELSQLGRDVFELMRTKVDADAVRRRIGNATQRK